MAEWRSGLRGLLCAHPMMLMSCSWTVSAELVKKIAGYSTHLTGSE